MYKALLATLLLCTTSLATPTIGNDDINRLRYKHEQKAGYKKSASDKRLPARFLEMEYRKPILKDWLLPYQDWDQHLRTYLQRQYGDSRLTFKPSMIVMHYTVTPSEQVTYDVLQRRKVGVQLMIGHDGTVYRLMPLDRRCNGAYGVDHVALSIEMVAETESDLLSRTNQVFSSFCLVRYLMSEYDIPLAKVVAHYEVGEGKKRVSEYTDLHDQIYPDRYPPSSARSDPGPTYMAWLRGYLRKNPPGPDAL